MSEMIALPIHGGGVTLERILGADLKRFDWFAETIRYDHESAATYPGARSHSFGFWPLERKLRPALGCSLSHALASHPFTRKCFARRAAHRLSKEEPALGTSRLLVCPQADVTLLMLQALRKRFEIEYVTWIMDDHLVTWRDGGWHYPPGFESLMREHLLHARQIFVISPAMRDFYRERFGVDSTVLCGPAAPLASEVPVPLPQGAVPRLVYFGSLGRWQNDAISLLAPVLAAGGATLDVYSHSPDSLPADLTKEGASVRGSIPASEVLARSAGYDAVVLPVSFREELRNMSYFNVATKFAECLASPVPTLLIGPADSAMVRIARSASACAIVDHPSPTLVHETITSLRDPARCREILAAERRLLAAEFSPDTMQGRWSAASAFLLQ